MEILEKVWNMSKINNKNTGTTSMTSFWYFYYFIFSSVFIVDFKQVNVSWDEWDTTSNLHLQKKLTKIFNYSVN